MKHRMTISSAFLLCLIPGRSFPQVAITGAEGTGAKLQLFTGSTPATNDCAKFDANHNLVTSGTTCGTGPTPATYLACDATGATDAAACIRAAVTGMTSGGVLIAQDHAIYALNTTVSFQAQNCTVVFQNPIYFQLNNATFNVSASIHTPDRMFCVHSLTNTYRDGTGLKVMSAAHRGDVLLTLTTTGDGAAFTVGDIIFIEGNGDADLGNQSINIVTSKAAACGSGTCTLSLEWPLAKDFTITPRVKDGQSGTGTNYIFQGPATLNNGELQAFIGTQTRNLQINDVTIYSNTMPTSDEPFQLNSSIECQMLNNTVTSSSGTIIEAAASSTHCVIQGNHVHTILSSTRVAPTGSAIGLGEGNESTRLVNNWCSIEGNAAATMGCLDITASFDAVISGNHFACGPGMSGACIITDNGGVFAAVNASITGNTINSNMAGLYAAQLSGSTAAGWATNLPGPITFTGNTITASNDNGIHCTGWCQISGNSLFIASGYGIIIEGTAGMNASISNNLIAAAAAATGFNGIIVVDPGAQQTNDPVIIGNQIVNYTTPISIQTPTNNALILICNNSLTVNTITCSQSATGSNLTGQTAAQSGVTLFTPPVTGSYRVTYYAKVTTPGTTSILGGTTGFVLHYTDGTDSVAQNLTLTEANQSGAILSIGTGNVTNTTAAVVYGSAVVKAKVGVAMTYDFGRTSTGTAMQYAIKVTVEAVTP